MSQDAASFQFGFLERLKVTMQFFHLLTSRLMHHFGDPGLNFSMQKPLHIALPPDVVENLVALVWPASDDQMRPCVLHLSF